MFQVKDMTRRRPSLMVFLIVLITVSISVLPISSQEIKQKVFGSPEEAMKSLADAVQAGDTKGMMAILGPEGHPGTRRGGHHFLWRCRCR
jgi:hypothetical protein